MKLSKQLLWNLLLIASLGMALFMGTKALVKYYCYARLTSQKEASITAWKVTPKGSYFFLEASYTFYLNDKSYSGQTTFTTPLYLNTWAAEEAQEALSKKRWMVFYSQKHPHIHSLERVFPLKEVIHCILTLGLFLYFLMLKHYISLKKASSEQESLNV